MIVLKFGKISLLAENGRYFIRYEDGEGMEISESELEKLLESHMRENF